MTIEYYDQIMIIKKGNRDRNTQSVTYAVKYALERKKIVFPKYIDFAEIVEFQDQKDFLNILDNQLKFGTTS